jgi:hypothetical protein
LACVKSLRCSTAERAESTCMHVVRGFHNGAVCRERMKRDNCMRVSTESRIRINGPSRERISLSETVVGRARAREQSPGAPRHRPGRRWEDAAHPRAPG